MAYCRKPIKVQFHVLLKQAIEATDLSFVYWCIRFVYYNFVIWTGSTTKCYHSNANTLLIVLPHCVDRIYREKHNLANLEIRNQGTYYGISRNGFRSELFVFSKKHNKNLGNNWTISIRIYSKKFHDTYSECETMWHDAQEYSSKKLWVDTKARQKHVRSIQ